jgi:hypothetical protein
MACPHKDLTIVEYLGGKAVHSFVSREHTVSQENILILKVAVRCAECQEEWEYTREKDVPQDIKELIMAARGMQEQRTVLQ